MNISNEIENVIMNEINGKEMKSVTINEISGHSEHVSMNELSKQIDIGNLREIKEFKNGK